jgi:hypothetical protein
MPLRQRAQSPAQAVTPPVQQGPTPDLGSNHAAVADLGPVAAEQGFLDGLQDEPLLRRPEIMDRMAETSAMTDGVARNLEITSLYHEVSTMLDQAIFSDPEQQGQTANWNTFGTWASNEAGRAIRGEGNWVMGLGNWVGEHEPTGLVQGQSEHTQAALAEGNNVVFSEIAPASAMFAENFGGHTERDPERWDAFVEWMREEAPNQDAELGNEMLIEAFDDYYDAMMETDPDRQQELMFRGNALIGMHEQTRLQEHVTNAMPFGARGFLTEHAMGLHIPTATEGPVGLDFDENYHELDLSEEVRDRDFWGRYATQYPEALQQLDDPSVQSVWEQVDPHWWNSGGTVGAENWTNFDDRMAFISELFRTHQNNPDLHQQPFTEEQAAAKLAE